MTFTEPHIQIAYMDVYYFIVGLQMFNVFLIAVECITGLRDRKKKKKEMFHRELDKLTHLHENDVLQFHSHF